MRVSRFNEHKLVLRDVVNTPDGESLFSAADKRAIANLPALDFYLPFTSQRQSWRPTADVYVAVTFDLNAAAVTAYGTNGQTLTVRRGEIPTVPLIILHLAEPKSTRSDLLANADEDLIESPSEPSAASSITSPAGASFLILPGDGGGGGGGGAPAPGTYINHFNIKADDGWFGGGQEMQFRSFAISAWQFVGGSGGSWFLIGNKCDKRTYYQNGVNTSQGYDGLFSISPTVTKFAPLSCAGIAGAVRD